MVSAMAEFLSDLIASLAGTDALNPFSTHSEGRFDLFYHISVTAISYLF